MGLQDLVIVTGMSGSGKGTVLKTFEDLGFFCIDNLPVPLIPKFIEGIHVAGGGFKQAALVIDIRAGDTLRDLERVLEELRKASFRLFILYLEARDEVIVRRFSETRRPHPLMAGRSVRAAIHMERHQLRKLRDIANVTIDTSDCTVHQVKAQVAQKFSKYPQAAAFKVVLMSFGFKNGVPLDADMVMDVRFLPNPFFVQRLRAFSGNDRKVKTYMRKFPETKEFLTRFQDLLLYLLPNYMQEGKRQITIGIGCTGGRHRSVFIAEETAKIIKNKNWIIQVLHRDEFV
jgi:RNase adapter protein RapZ